MHIMSGRNRTICASRYREESGTTLPLLGELDIVTTLDGFTLAGLSVTVFAPPETFRALYDDIIERLETKYEQNTWEVHSQDDVTEDSKYRDLDGLRQEAEVASRSS